MSHGRVFAFRGGSRLGPFTVEEARILIQSGEIRSDEKLILDGRLLTAIDFFASITALAGFDGLPFEEEENMALGQIAGSPTKPSIELSSNFPPNNGVKVQQADAPSEQKRDPHYPPKLFPRLSKQTISLRGSIILGYLCSGLALLLFPPITGLVAFFSGVYVLLRGRVAHGVAIILASLAAMLVGLALGRSFSGPENKNTTMDLPAIHAATIPAVVKVSALNSKGDVIKSGTGFLIEDGMIVTNYHVVEGATEVRITMSDGSDSDCRKIVALDRMRDLAIFVPKTPPAKALRISDGSGPSEGERVAVIGNPLGLDGTLSDGIVSANRTDGNGVNIIQITAPISRGSSGSPVVNSHGEVLGIATMIFSGGQNLNFAVSAHEITKVLRAKKTGNRD